MIPEGAASWLDERHDANPGPETRAIQIRNLQVSLRTAHAWFDKVT
jgi:hypothetical protein